MFRCPYLIQINETQSILDKSKFRLTPDLTKLTAVNVPGSDPPTYCGCDRRNAVNLPMGGWLARSRPRRDDRAVVEDRAMEVMAIAKFERFFRLPAGHDVGKSDLKRYGDFVNDKIYDLLLRAQAAAKANGRDVIEPHDLPITKGLQERIHEFRRIDEQIELQPILDQLAARPPLDLAYSEETEARVPEIAGGINVALAHSVQ